MEHLSNGVGKWRLLSGNARVRLFILSVLVLITMLKTSAVEAPATQIRLNTIGYLPESPKKASVATPCTNLTVTRISDGRTMLTGTVSGPLTNTDTREELYIADFSALREPGEYRLVVPNAGESPSFRIGPEVYRMPFYTVTRGMYLWRCGTAVSATCDGRTFAHGVCHTNDAWLDYVTGSHEQKNSTKGWHDAGDYNKYVVNAGVTVGCMLRAWEDFGPAIRRVRLDLPESRGKLPEFLAEVKWETDWLLTMQLPDGSVSHKVTTRKFGPFILPEQEKEDRYFTAWSSAATADFVAMLAQAARSFRPYDPAYADQCLAAARKSYAFLQTHPTNHNADLKAFSTGGYGTRDADDRLWAAAELWETTGDSQLLQDLETRLKSSGAAVQQNFDWGEVGNLGVFTYLLSKRTGRDSNLVAQCRNNVLQTADKIVQARMAHGYARPLGSTYYWGGNGGVARQALILHTANQLAQKADYRDTILDGLNHLLGRNYHGRSYVTGLGYRPPLRPHDRRSGGDNVDEPWPGYLVGGPNPKATDWQDKQEDYRTNEIAINWNGALIYALAAALPNTN
ncbi:MAG TPA: glycoside hydrolase family 9 protein [Clostridia bacterium]|nr:glycoside hydrolase family 9 protein [Clostridia bacterium]